MTTEEIKRQVAAEFIEDGVTPDEVVLRGDGEIIIDRRRKFPDASPIAVGRWR